MPNPERLPLFPLQAVLFPGGRLTLKVFEARYLDMIATCMKSASTFGVCLVAPGDVQEGLPPVHPVGTEARIIDWDMSQPGILGLEAEGVRRFRVLAQATMPAGWSEAVVEPLPEAATPEECPHLEALQPLLGAVLRDAGPARIAPPYHLEDASWVGFRYAEILPIPALARQRLLELEDPVLRLSILHAYLSEHGLLKPD